MTLWKEPDLSTLSAAFATILAGAVSFPDSNAGLFRGQTLAYCHQRCNCKVERGAPKSERAK